MRRFATRPVGETRPTPRRGDSRRRPDRQVHREASTGRWAEQGQRVAYRKRESRRSRSRTDQPPGRDDQTVIRQAATAPTGSTPARAEGNPAEEGQATRRWSLAVQLVRCPPGFPLVTPCCDAPARWRTVDRIPDDGRIDSRQNREPENKITRMARARQPFRGSRCNHARMPVTATSAPARSTSTASFIFAPQASPSSAPVASANGSARAPGRGLTANRRTSHKAAKGGRHEKAARPIGHR